MIKINGVNMTNQAPCKIFIKNKFPKGIEILYHPRDVNPYTILGVLDELQEKIKVQLKKTSTVVEFNPSKT